MSRIAIIDTAIDNKYINNKVVEHINLCGKSNYYCNDEISHGTMCAIVLDYCASDYELVNIQIFENNRGKVFGEIGRLAEALKLCLDMKIEIISLSAVSSLLSDSKLLFDISWELCKSSYIVSALDNSRYISVPTSYPHVIGVRCDVDGLLSPGEIAYCADSPYNANIFANCDLEVLQKYKNEPSNSYAVPVVSAFVNGLLNQGKSKNEIESLIYNLNVYPNYEQTYKSVSSLLSSKRDIPVVFLSDIDVKYCCDMMDCLYEKYEVQSSALSFSVCPYDIRLKTVKNTKAIQHDLHFMERHYKTDIIFLLGSEMHLDEIQYAVDIDVKLIRQSNNQTLISYERNCVLESDLKIADRLYEILTTQE